MLRIIINIIIITAPFQNPINGLKASTMSTHKNEPPKEVQVSSSFYKYCVPFLAFAHAVGLLLQTLITLLCSAACLPSKVMQFLCTKKKGLWQRLEPVSYTHLRAHETA